MKIHEYQAKEFFRKYEIPVPEGRSAVTAEEAGQLATTFSGPYVVKAQIHAGGRGKGGGIKVGNTPEEVKELAGQIIGMNLVTHQTGPEGRIVGTVLVEKASDIEREIYLAVVIDRETSKIAIISSSEGGVEIETVAANTPEKINKHWVDPTAGLMPYQARSICFKLGLTGQAFKDGVKCVNNLYKLFIGEELTLAEINPLVVTKEGELIALDAKLNLDGDTVFRHPEHPGLRDTNEEDPLEVEASKHGLSYIKLSGSVGCMVNGAGLAMATMDLIKLSGSEPANFLDVGGTASSEAVENAFRILMMDKSVKCVLINIFGGIVRCDRVATGVVEAIRNIGNVEVPIVARLEGTNAKEGIEILNSSGLPFHTISGFKEAAEKAVELAGGA
ncbi:MAG: ADP-forming succinate--CoA ligase subunit beta [Thermoplasmata archaeon]|nr:ADP-forming succinate--CoA ligase subunit beta [Thermoplasmata archaeon]